MIGDPKVNKLPKRGGRALTIDDPVGTPVDVVLDSGRVWRTSTRGPIWELCGTRVVQLEGYSGGYRVDRCTVQLTHRDVVFAALAAAESNGYTVRYEKRPRINVLTDDPFALGIDLCDYCPDLEGCEPAELAPHVAEWQRNRKAS